jgi:hypothetical protein
MTEQIGEGEAGGHVRDVRGFGVFAPGVWNHSPAPLLPWGQAVMVQYSLIQGSASD